MFSGGEFLNRIRLQNADLGQLFDQLINHLNNQSMHAQIDGSGKIEPPAAIDNVNVSIGNGLVHVTHDHNSAINKNIHYFTEYSTDGQVSWHVVPHGPSRETTIALPATDTAEEPNTYNYIFRGYAQYPGSDPSPPTYFGGSSTPTVVNVGGTSALELLPATGSGTGVANGQQGGVGFGKAIQRPATTASRLNLNSV